MTAFFVDLVISWTESRVLKMLGVVMACVDMVPFVVGVMSVPACVAVVRAFVAVME